MKAFAALLLLCLLPAAHAQFYDVAIVHVNDSLYSSLVYDENSTSYKDNSLENPDALLRVCASEASELLGRHVSLAYADGFDGNYLLVTHTSVPITSVPPDNCPILPLEISSFRAWYPSIPYVFISNTTDMDLAARWKLSRLRGWFNGDFGVERNQSGSLVNISVMNATDDMNVSIVPDVNYLVIGLVRDDYTTMDTAISSINDTVFLTADSPGAPYQVFINGIGPDLPPYVEILTPEPITYESGTIPFTYIMMDDDDIVSCWYVLDGASVNMPVCGPAYILNVGTGTHSLTLYGQDTTGNVGSDSVTFQVGEQPYVPPGGGPPGTPYYPHVPPPPPDVLLSVNPYDFCVTVDYPLDGQKLFELTSTADLTDVQCFVRGDFGEYAYVEIQDTIRANTTIIGKIVIDMEPLEILDYNESLVSALQCIGKSDPTLIASTISNVCLILHKPTLNLQNKTIELDPGFRGNVTLLINNTGIGNATVTNITFEIARYKSMVFPGEYPDTLAPGESAVVTMLVDLWDVAPGTYTVPIDVFEMGRFMTRGHLAINVKKPSLPYSVCEIADVTWTLMILVIGFFFAMRHFYMKLKSEMLHEQRLRGRRKMEKWRKYVTPLKFALGIMALTMILWTIVVWLLTRCD
ncbi:MAG: hypothetical protein ABII71_00465 [Candidatus Micrarchaeota archaeon]